MKGKWLLALFSVVVVMSLATMPGCGLFHFDSFGHVIGNLQCQDAHVRVLPGQSGELMNPCQRFSGGTIDGQWQDFGDLGGDDFVTGEEGSCTIGTPVPVNGIRVDPTFTWFAPTKRLLVVDKTVQPMLDLPVYYIYSNLPGAGIGSGVGFGTLFVTTAAMTISVTANPTTVVAGNPSQLNASVTGGVAPYSYAWSPAASLSDKSLANPVATPRTTTTYTLTVTDSTPNVKLTASASVTVMVFSSVFRLTTIVDPNSTLFVTSNPPGISCFRTTCSFLFSARKNVILTVDANSAFWSGCDAHTNSTCTVFMDADRAVTVLP
jgi:hypothetical protein